MLQFFGKQHRRIRVIGLPLARARIREFFLTTYVVIELMIPLQKVAFKLDISASSGANPESAG